MKERDLPNKKIKVGWFTFTCCEGCAIIFIELLNDYFEEWKEKIEFKHFRLLKSKNAIEGLDLAIVEGAIATRKDLNLLIEIREKSKKVMAVGSCALIGMPAALRNDFDKKKTEEIRHILERFDYLDKVEPVSRFINVDYRVPGCPMDDKKFVEEFNAFLKNYL
ncbi:MAG: hypothetical protein NZ903_00510 [Candidatus Micrarchaeota archaeon]|nr:hypothetical protein [Candidatus Micrarchaeota archaeon]